MKVNCAAIPTELIESELFGHEKGAFTGAAALRRGKFELADGGTIFLDEVGDLHEASQAKLLRVLQDGEFQRVGGEQTIRVAVARHLGDQPPARRARRGRPVPRGSLLPAERRADPRARAARAACRTSPSWCRTSSTEFCARNNFRPRDDRSGRRRAARALRLAGQRPRAAERRRAHGDPDARRSHHRRRDPAGESGRRRRRARRRGCRRCATPPSASASGRRSTRPTGTSRRAARLLGTERTALHKRIRALGLKRQHEGK